MDSSGDLACAAGADASAAGAPGRVHCDDPAAPSVRLQTLSAMDAETVGFAAPPTSRIA